MRSVLAGFANFANLLAVVQPHCPGPLSGGCGVQQSCCCLSHAPGTLRSCLRTPPHQTTRAGPVSQQQEQAVSRVTVSTQGHLACHCHCHCCCVRVVGHTDHHQLAPAQTCCCCTHHSPTMGRPRWEHLLDTAYTSSSTATISTLLPPSSTTCGHGAGSSNNHYVPGSSQRCLSRHSQRLSPGTPYCMHLPDRPANKLGVQPYLPACHQHP